MPVAAEAVNVLRLAATAGAGRERSGESLDALHHATPGFERRRASALALAIDMAGLTPRA